MRIVFVLVIILYFLCACAAVWVTLFPDGRAFVQKSSQLIGGASRSVVRGGYVGAGRAARGMGSAGTGLADFFSPSWQWVQAHRWLSLGGVAVVTLPPLAIVLLSSGVQLDGFTDGEVRENVQVAVLLKGEQLVPPAPLPPEFFTTPEVELYRPMLQTASRNWQLLEPEFAQRLLLVFKIMREQHGYDMTLLEGYRSPERQDALARMGSHVTNAKAFQSYHQYGLAADCAFVQGGKIVISERDAWAMKGYTLYGQVAESVGLHWGGRWKMLDLGHTEWRKPGVIR